MKEFRTYSLGEIGEIVSGATPKTNESGNFGGDIAWLTPADLSGYTSKYISHGARNLTEKGYNSCGTRLMPKGAVLFSSRAPIGYVVIAENPICTNQGFKSIVPNDGINSEFLYYQLIYLRESIQDMGSGTTFKEISGKKFSTIRVVIPPTMEQERIVTRIEELFSQLDAGVETLKKTKAQLAVYRQAVLKEAFEGRLTNHQKISTSLSWIEGKEDSALPLLPAEWRYVSLKELGELGRGKSKHRPRNDPKLFSEGKYPFIQTGDVKAARKFIKDYSKQYGEFGLQQSKLWPKGTLCITIAANIAETAFLGIDACFPDSVVGFVPNENVNVEYIRYFVESQKLRLWAFAPATAQKNINLDTLENLIVPYCSIEEQKNVIFEIESRLSVCDSIEQTVDTALQQAEAMRQSILKDAFEGRL